MATARNAAGGLPRRSRRTEGSAAGGSNRRGESSPSALDRPRLEIRINDVSRCMSKK